MNQQIQRVSIKGIVHKDNSIFMLKDHKGNWELPGGRIDFGEHPDETVKREFKEELNIDEVKVGEIVDIWDFTSSVDSTDYHFIIIVFGCEVDLSKFNISDEHIESAWVPFEKINDFQMKDGYRESIRKYFHSIH